MAICLKQPDIINMYSGCGKNIVEKICYLQLAVNYSTFATMNYTIL